MFKIIKSEKHIKAILEDEKIDENIKTIISHLYINSFAASILAIVAILGVCALLIL